MTNNAALTDTFIVSDSWGLCEDFLPPSFLQAESYQLQLAAAAGLSFYAASGDSGSSDCESVQPSDTQPGRRRPRLPAVRDRRRRHRPSLGQRRRQHRLEARRRRHLPELVAALLPERQPPSQLRQWRQVRQPRRLLPAGARHRARRQPNTGYIIECTSTASGCPSGIPWFPVGGTSAGAPLMAAITADANTYSASPRRPSHGIREPLPLQPPDACSGTSPRAPTASTAPASTRPAVGYDPATGLGSPKADLLATALAGFTPVVPSPDATNLVVTSPTATKTIKYGQKVILAGTLTDSSEHRS